LFAQVLMVAAKAGLGRSPSSPAAFSEIPTVFPCAGSRVDRRFNPSETKVALDAYNFVEFVR
jgi:hypothetical protein